jgi:diphthine-ammonia ligase
MPRPQAIALISGGKDSLLSLYHAIANGYDIVALGNLHPRVTSTSTAHAADETGTTIYRSTPSAAAVALGPAAESSDELDSYMYQTIGHTLLPLYASCLDLPLYRRAITGDSVNQSLDYEFTCRDETEDLTLLLRSIRRQHPGATAVTSGAILSTYQRTRIENVCGRLGLTSLAYLWRMPQEGVLGQLLGLGFDAKIVKVAALGLDKGWLWENVADTRTIGRLGKLKERWGINPAGEGGEYESLAVSAPGWRGKIVVPEEARVVVQEGGGAAWISFKMAQVEMVDEGKGRRQEEWVERLQKLPLLEPKFEQLLEDVNAVVSAAPPPVSKATDAASIPYDVPEPTIITTMDTLFISNLFTLTPEPSLESETAALFHLATSILTPYSLTLPQITAVALHLATMDSFAAVNAVYNNSFSSPLPPSRACLSLPLPASRRLSLSFSIPLQPARHRQGLHVQSHSYWAPANIGPYSQSILSTSGWWETAGQIPLVPASMALPQDGGMALQSVLALQHLHRIWEAVGAKGVAAVAWVADESAVTAAVETWKRWKGGAEVMVCAAIGLPRGAGVEWVGYGVGVSAEEGKEVRMVYDDGGMVEVEVGGEEVAVVYVDCAWDDAGEFEKRWREKGGRGGVVRVAGVWDSDGRRRKVGTVVRRGV